MRRSTAFLFIAFARLSEAGDAPEAPVVLPLTVRENSVLITARVNDVEVSLVVDTGYSRSVALAEEALTKVGAVAIGETTRRMDAKGNVMSAPKYNLSQIRIGTAEFQNVQADLDVHHPSYQATEVGQQGFLGTALLKEFRAVFDFRGRTLSLHRSNADVPACRGVSVPFVPEWNGEPATQVGTDLGTVILWWDTGAPISMLAKRFVTERAENQRGEQLTSMRLTLGPGDFGPAVFHVEELALPKGFEGFIGFDFFTRHSICMDFPMRRLFVN